MKIYLSGPMSGIKDFNAPAFREAAKELRKQKHIVVSPVEEDEAEGIVLDGEDGELHSGGATWGDCLARDVKLIANGNFDAIALLDGWGQSKGARLELTLALLLRLKVFDYDRGNLTQRSSESAAYMLQHYLI